jgi:histidine triad (HIT) family protein
MPGQYAGVKKDNPCIFCEIRDGLTKASMVGEGKDWLAFLDVRPLFLGHVLLIPRLHVPTVMELPDDLAGPLMQATTRLSRAVRDGMDSDGIFTASNNGVSQSVDHLHIHIVPRNKKDGLRGFMWPRLEYDDDDHMAATAARIGEALQ